MSHQPANIHQFVYSTVEPTLRAHSKVPENVVLSEERVYRTMFKNFRYVHHEPFGLRLTQTGNTVMEKFFEKYQFENASKVNHTAMIILDQNMQWPYYVGNKYVAFYLQSDAAWYMMAGSDLNQYVKMI